MAVEIVELSTPELLEMYPFFGSTTLCVDSVRVQKTDSGEFGTTAIGSWVIPARFTDEHFRNFQASGRDVIDLTLLPGHFWAEALGQTLGALVFLKYPGHRMDVLPTFKEVLSRYREAAFTGDRVNLCVEMNELPIFDERGRLSVIQGRGVSVFNERVLAIADPIKVNILPLAAGSRGLQSLRTKHQTEPWIEASFENIPKYFAAAADNS